MTQEEKAKAYDEALERAKKVKHDIENIGCAMAPDMLEVIFPELCESEDERIRKDIIAFIKAVACKTAISEEREGKWIVYLEKQKEQKPAEKQDYSGLSELERAIHRGFLAAGVKNVPVPIIKETAKESLAQMKPVWSEEDEIKLKLCEDSFRVPQTRQHLIQQGLTPGDMVSWLKSLRPSWKPSEEQMEALKDAVKLYKEAHFEIFHTRIESLYEQLKAL